jgi:hypothetical protein
MKKKVEVFINETVWKKFTDSEMLKFQEAVFQHYREAGYPHYVLTEGEKHIAFKKLAKFDHANLISSGVVRQSMHGLGLAWSYFPHAVNVRCKNMRTPLEVFNNDDLLRKAIGKRIKYGTYMSDSGMRKTLRSFTGTQAVSNFRPSAAAAIYHRYVPEGGTTWDMSSGWGGRLLGAMACSKVGRYIGNDPATATFKGLCTLRNEITPLVSRPFQVDLHCEGSEVFRPRANSVDLCFTSPPYFGIEKYSTEDTQSYLKFPTNEEWLAGFMYQTVKNCLTSLTPGGILVLNVSKAMGVEKLRESIETTESIEGNFLSRRDSRQ